MSNPNDISLTLLLFSMLLLSPLKDTHAQDFIRQLETQGKASFQFTPPFDDSTELDDIEKIEMFGAGDGQMSIVLGFGRRPGRYVISLKNGQFSEYVDARDIDYDRSPRSNHAAGFLQRHVVGTGPSYPRNDTMIARAPTVTFGKTTYHYLDAHLLDVTPGKVILRMKVAVPNENKGFNKSDILVAADDELKPLEPVTGTFPGESIDQCTSANGLIYIESEWIDTDSPRIRLRHHWVIDSHEKDAVLQHCTFNSQDIYGPNPNPSVVLFNNCDPKVVPSQLGRALVWVDVEEYFVHNKEKGVIARPFPFADDFVAAGLIKADEQLAVYGETKSGQPHVIHLLDVDTGREVQSIHLDGVQRGRVEIQGCQTGKRFCVAYETVSGRRFDVYELDDEEGWALIFRSTDTIDIDVISHWDLDDLGQHIAYCTDENLVVLRVDAVTPRKHGKQGQDRSSPLTGISRNDLGFEDTPANVDKAFVGFLPDKASFESFSPNERWSVGNLEGSRKLGFYNLVDNTLTERVVGDEEMTAAAWTGNGTTVATAHTDRIYVWSVEGSTKALATSDSLQAMSQNLEREQREVVSGTFKSIDWVHDGKRLLCTSIEGVAIFQVDGRDIMLESCVGTSNLGCDFDQKSGRLLVLKPDNE
ncbi:MAG: hypothetical protein KDA80_23425, partial [Planctomycetaceae bacterium]|nr:hypothetical protein [Planctomycetaceae bacterium]